MSDTAFPGYPARKALLAGFLIAVSFHLALFAFVHHFPSFTKLKVTPPKKLRVRLVHVSPAAKMLSVVRKIHPSRYVPPVPPKETPRPQKVEKPKPKVTPKPRKKPVEKVKPVPKKVPIPKPLPNPRPKPVPAELLRLDEIARIPMVATPEPLPAAPSPVRQKVEPGPPGPTTPPPPRREVAFPDYGRNPALIYPLLARRRGIEGKVILKVLVSKEGCPLKVTLERSSGYTILDKAAMKAVRGWIFKPGKLNGVPVRMWVRVPVLYRLR